MILIDTSVWIAHFRSGGTALSKLLNDSVVLTHPGVIGELACGNLKNRKGILADLTALPVAAVASDDEVLHLIDDRQLWGRGLGWIDTHLIASALLSDCRLATLDRQLEATAQHAGSGVYRISL